MMYHQLSTKNKFLIIGFILLLLTSLWPNNIYILVLFSFSTYIILPINKWWDTTALLLFVFSLLYSAILLMTDQVLSNFILIAYAIAPVAFYRLGRWLLATFRDEEQRQRMLLFGVSLFLLPLFILTVKDIAVVGIINVSRAMTGSISSEEAMSATYYGLLSSIGIGCLPAIFSNGQKIQLRFAYVVVSLLSILVVIHLVNRTGLVIAFVILIISIMYITKMRLNKMIKVFFLLLVVALLMYQLGIINDDIFVAYQSRENNASFEAKDLGGRLQLWTNALNKMFTNPFGWQQESYAHNFLLDTARACGWLPFIILSTVTLVWLKYLLKLLKKVNTSFVLFIVCINISMLMSVMVEPVLDCSILYFSIFMLFWGITRGLSTEKTFK